MKLKSALWVIGMTLRYCFSSTAVFALIMLLGSFMGILINVLQKDLINGLTASIKIGGLNKTFIIFAVLYIVVYFIKDAFAFFSTFGSNYSRCNINLLFQKIFMLKSSETPQNQFFVNSFMDKYSFVSGNTTKISEYIGNILNLLFTNISMIAGTIVLFYLYEPYLIAYAVLVAAVYSVITYLISKKQYELSKKQITEQRYHDYYKSILSDKATAREVRIYKIKAFIFNKWDRFYNKLKNERLDLAYKNTDLLQSSRIVTYALQIISIFVLLYGVFHHKYDIGTFVMLLGLVTSCNDAVYQIVNNLFSGVYNQLNYIVDYVDFVSPVTREDLDKIKTMKISGDLLPFGAFRELKAENVSFKYPNGERNAVEHINLEIVKGEIISILGYNGSGKTTLSKLLSGMLLPCGGAVYINGNKITRDNKDDVFKYFGIAFQEYTKYSLSIKENVSIGRIERFDDEKQLHLAYKNADLDEFISKYNASDETILGKEYSDNGIDLSGGEWQKIILARAYMGEPEILILDEPTASIDPLKELDMIARFREILGGKTAVLISHRIGFARLADRIIMMDGGLIVEEGTHEELLAKGGYYARLFNEQKKLYSEKAVIV